MRSLEIDLAEPFEKILATVLALPRGCGDAATDCSTNQAELKQVVRGLYEAANGRHVETSMGLVAIAPPTFEFLKAKPFRVDTQTDLLIEAAARLVAGMVTADFRDQITEAVVKDKSGDNAWIGYRPTPRARTSLVLTAG